MKVEVEKPIRVPKEDLKGLPKEALLEYIEIIEEREDGILELYQEILTMSVIAGGLIDKIHDKLEKEINHCENENAESHNVCSIHIKFLKELMSDVSEGSEKIYEISEEYDDYEEDDYEEDD